MRDWLRLGIAQQDHIEFAQTAFILAFLTSMTASFCSLNILLRQLFHHMQCTAHIRNVCSLFMEAQSVTGNSEYHVGYRMLKKSLLRDT